MSSATAIPGYVVPGQIICPLIDKKNGITRKYIAGHGVTLTEIKNYSDASAASIAALTATVVGKVAIRDVSGATATDATNTPATPKKLVFEVSIEDKFQSITRGSNFADQAITRVTRVSSAPLPEVGDVVLARVTKLTLKQAHVEILVVEAAGPVTADPGVGVNGATPGVVPASIVSASVGAAATDLAVTAATAAAISASDVGEGFGGIIRVQDVRITERDKVKILDSFRPGDIVRATVISLGDGTNYYLSTARNDLGVVFARSQSGDRMFPVDWQTMKAAHTGELELRKCAKPYIENVPAAPVVAADS
jgi:exosome complex component CSL4